MDSVQEQKSEIKYRMRYLSDVIKDAIFYDYQTNVPVAKIMKKYDISRGTVYNVLNKIKKGGETDGDKKESTEQG